MRLISVLLILMLILTVPVFAHHKDEHSGGSPGDKGKPDDVPKDPKDKSSVPDPQGKRCDIDNITVVQNVSQAYGRCVIYDNIMPYIAEATEINGAICLKINDNIGAKKVTLNEVEFWKYPGSYNWFCGSISYGTYDLKAIDYADNTLETAFLYTN